MHATARARTLGSAGRAEVMTGGGLGDIGELYAALSPRLKWIVGLDVRAPGAVIEDACQLAWGRLMRHRDRVDREAVFAWLATTATREALLALRRQSRCSSLEGTIERLGEEVLPDRSPGADEVFEHRARLAQLGALPQRQRQVLWLQGLGYSYAEIASITGASLRTVERQLMRGKRRLGSLRAD